MQNKDLISRAAVVKMLHEKAKSYSPSMFSTEGECYIAKVIAMEALQEVADMPAVDAKPVKRGKWIKRGHWAATCSECNFLSISYYVEKYCPNCGAELGGAE